MEMDNDRSKPEEDDSSALKADLVRAKLGLVVHYAILGFAPVVSVLALIFAVMAYTGRQADHARLSETNSRIDSISAIQSAPKDETDIFQVSLAREKALLAEERKNQVEKDSKIISSVTQMQVKLKISPTLQEQLSGAVQAPVAASHVASAPVAASPVAATAPAPAAASIPAKAEKKPLAQPSAKPADAVKKPVPVAKDIKKKPAPVPTTAEKSAKAKALKKTIEDFNKRDKK